MGGTEGNHRLFVCFFPVCRRFPFRSFKIHTVREPASRQAGCKTALRGTPTIRVRTALKRTEGERTEEFGGVRSGPGVGVLCVATVVRKSRHGRMERVNEDFQR